MKIQKLYTLKKILIKDFNDTDKSYWEITENEKYYKIFKVVNSIEARYFIKTYGEYGKIYELKHIAF